MRVIDPVSPQPIGRLTTSARDLATDTDPCTDICTAYVATPVGPVHLADGG